jgi:tetratricopeptide (TPR) repeat protein
MPKKEQRGGQYKMKWFALVLSLCMLCTITACDSVSKQVERYIEQGDTCYANGEWQEAFDAYSMALELDPAADVDSRMALVYLK